MWIWIHIHTWFWVQASEWMCGDEYAAAACLCTFSFVFAIYVYAPLYKILYLYWMELTSILGFPRLVWYGNIDMHLSSILLLSFTVPLVILRSNLLCLRSTMLMVLQLSHLRGNMHLYRGICTFLYAQCIAPHSLMGYPPSC